MAMTKAEKQTAANFGLLGIFIALVITIGAGWIASSRPFSKVDAAEYKSLQSSLQSYAAESHLIASEYRDHRASNNYVKISATKLHAAVSKLSDQIEEQDVYRPVAGKTDKLTNSASDLEQALSDLARLPGSQKAAQIDNQIKDVWSAVEEL